VHLVYNVREFVETNYSGIDEKTMQGIVIVKWFVVYTERVCLGAVLYVYIYTMWEVEGL
jgi:hypothetical protein